MRMLIYNDQNEFVNKRNEKTYLSLIPEDNVWVKLNKKVDFMAIGQCLKEHLPVVEEEPVEEVVRLFKYLLLKAYYHLADADVVLKTKTDITFRYFLDYDPLDMDLVDIKTLQRFRRQELSLENEKHISAVLGLDANKLEGERLLSSLKREITFIEEYSYEYIGTAFENKNINDMSFDEVKAHCNKVLASIQKSGESEVISSKIRYLQEMISDLDAMNDDRDKFTLQTMATAFLVDRIESF